MRVIIAGSRTFYDLSQLEETIKLSGFTITEVVSGRAKGADYLGECWAGDNGIPIKEFPAGWDIHGRQAGFIRNVEMAEYGEALIALWDGRSRGTEHMIKTAKEKGLQVFVNIVEPNPPARPKLNNMKPLPGFVKREFTEEKS